MDQVKEGLFNALGQFFDGGTVLDLYAGSGNLGLEAISRGCDQAVFIDRSSQAIKIIKSNIKKLRLEDRTFILKSDAFSALNLLHKKNYQFDLIFLDPPFNKQPFSKLMPLILEYNLLKDDGLVICETLKETVLEVQYEQLIKKREYHYGSTKVTIYHKEGANVG